MSKVAPRARPAGLRFARLRRAMKTLTRTLFVAALSMPFAVLAQTAPTAPTAPKTPTADTSKAGGAAKTPAPDTAKKEKLTDAELQIVAHYHGDNLTEVELGKLAGKRSASKDVKAYGEMLVKHHGDLDKQMQALAKKTAQVIPPEKPTDPAKKEALESTKKRVAALQKLNGAAFDREYLSLMVDNHALAVAGVDAHVAEAKNAELAQMLRDAKPILQGHLDRARELAAKEGQAAATPPAAGTTGTPAKTPTK
jgi:putative membrane protein